MNTSPQASHTDSQIALLVANPLDAGASSGGPMLVPGCPDPRPKRTAKWQCLKVKPLFQTPIKGLNTERVSRNQFLRFAKIREVRVAGLQSFKLLAGRKDFSGTNLYIFALHFFALSPWIPKLARNWKGKKMGISGEPGISAEFLEGLRANFLRLQVFFPCFGVGIRVVVSAVPLTTGIRRKKSLRALRPGRIVWRYAISETLLL